MAPKKAIEKKFKKGMCPFFQTQCPKGDCELYHKDFDRCGLDLLAYNLYGLTAELKKYNEEE